MMIKLTSASKRRLMAMKQETGHALGDPDRPMAGFGRSVLRGIAPLHGLNHLFSSAG
jgi:hypothetical protein